ATKRGGHFLTFNGMRCYQVESFLNDGRTSVNRAFLADDLGFNLLVIGGKEPVEQDPEFEKLMSGFAFLKPPNRVAGSNVAPYGANVSDVMGQLVGGLLFVVFIIVAGNALTRKKKRPERRNFDDDDRAFANASSESSMLLALKSRQVQRNVALET